MKLPPAHDFGLDGTMAVGASDNFKERRCGALGNNGEVARWVWETTKKEEKQMRVFGVSVVLGFAVCLGCQQNASSIPESKHVQHVDEASFQKEVLDSLVPVLVDFYADWCGPCQRQAPLLEEIASEHPNVKIVKVNVETSPRLAARYQIRSIPSLKVFRDGKVVAQHVGLADRSQLKSLLSQ